MRPIRRSNAYSTGKRGSVQPSSTFVGTTAVVGAIALLGSGVASAAQVEWQDCTEMLGIEAEYVPAGLECGTVEVPVDYTAPDAAKTQIALTRIKASSGQARSTVFGNPGGPGNYALNFWSPVSYTHLTLPTKRIV